MGKPDQEIFRLAFRHEGENWNAYFAPPGSMEGALLLGSISMSLIINNDEIKQAFIHLIQSALTNALEDENLEWDAPKKAPEHERAGHS